MIVELVSSGSHSSSSSGFAAGVALVRPAPPRSCSNPQEFAGDPTSTLRAWPSRERCCSLPPETPMDSTTAPKNTSPRHSTSTLLGLRKMYCIRIASRTKRSGTVSSPCHDQDATETPRVTNPPIARKHDFSGTNSRQTFRHKSRTNKSRVRTLTNTEKHRTTAPTASQDQHWVRARDLPRLWMTTADVTTVLGTRGRVDSVTVAQPRGLDEHDHMFCISVDDHHRKGTQQEAARAAKNASGNTEKHTVAERR